MEISFVERLKQWIVHYSFLKGCCHIHHGYYCNCSKLSNEKYSLSLKKAYCFWKLNKTYTKLVFLQEEYKYLCKIKGGSS